MHRGCVTVHQNFALHLRPGSSDAKSPPGAMGTTGPPLCPCCGTALAQLKTTELQAAWAPREGVSWSSSARRPYFHFCQPCHMRIWPEDVRPPHSNRFCRPGQPSWQGRGERQRALLGDLCLNTSPPELYSAVAQEKARAARERRSEGRREADHSKHNAALMPRNW